MKTQILHWFGLLSVLIFAGLLAGESVACVTCENMACKSITSGGALNCQSGSGLFGSYCNLSGSCTSTTSGRGGITPTTGSLEHDPFTRDIRGVFGTRFEVQAQVAQGRQGEAVISPSRVS